MIQAMAWPEEFKGDEDKLSFLVALVLLLTLVACQKPVDMRAKRVLIPLEVVGVIVALKSQRASLRTPVPAETCSDSTKNVLTSALRMTLRPPTLTQGTHGLPPLT